jgi:hypothetical protein
MMGFLLFCGLALILVLFVLLVTQHYQLTNMQTEIKQLQKSQRYFNDFVVNDWKDNLYRLDKK